MRHLKTATAVIVIAAAATAVHFFGPPAILVELLDKQAVAAAPPAGAMQAMPVPVAAVVTKTLPLYLDYTARTEAIRSVALQAKVPGYILDQPASDGADVRQGDLLYRIDPRDYQAALDQAMAQLQRDTASLDYARASLKRGTDLNKTGFLSTDAYQQLASTAAQGEATITADKAAIEAAQLNLGYTDIRAPFAGRLGRNQAAEGTLVTAGGNPLNTLVQVSPIYVTFSPSETDLAAIRKAMAAGKVPVEVSVPGDSGPAHKGELTFIDNTVDPGTGTIIARATIANADRVLLPGQYVNARLLIGEQPDALMVPQVSLGSGQMGKFVYVVEIGNTVGVRQVNLGQTDGELVAVTGGLTAGDTIIVGNLQKIGPGMPVAPMPEQPATTAAAGKS